MKAKEFILQKYPNAASFPMIDNHRRQTSYVIMKMAGIAFEIFPNEGARTPGKAWTNAKKYILETEKQQSNG